jgi:hypothetical protein
MVELRGSGCPNFLPDKILKDQKPANRLFCPNCGNWLDCIYDGVRYCRKCGTLTWCTDASTERAVFVPDRQKPDPLFRAVLIGVPRVLVGLLKGAIKFIVLLIATIFVGLPGMLLDLGNGDEWLENVFDRIIDRIIWRI